MTVALTDLAAARSPVRVDVLAAVSRTWRFNVPAIERTLRQLGVQDPVVLQTTRGRTASGRAIWRTRRQGREHVIRVDATANPSLANRILWHELAHVVQAEEWASPREWDDAYADAGGGRGRGYRTNHYELEANRWEANAEHTPLVLDA